MTAALGIVEASFTLRSFARQFVMSVEGGRGITAFQLFAESDNGRTLLRGACVLALVGPVLDAARRATAAVAYSD